MRSSIHAAPARPKLAQPPLSHDGFSLVEAMVAATLLAVALTALAALFGIAMKNVAVARNGTVAAVLAAQKMEELSGALLTPSPANTLQAATDGYVDYLDPDGNELGGGTLIPDNTAYIRRWYVEALPGSPNSTVVVQVLVTRRRDRGQADQGSVARAPEEARLVAVRTRLAP
ncbi:MAG TPA: prepilin-type N-terminal cleavage/methylation domain-containing protein [Vicinamibacterales bacterium]|jgi:type II secretory pathway pseudopilin PulG|nr:prepilin-type N-terminal cleavage/methylation domain-containing protein [Vicinamibacterales bacterium]